VLITTSAGSVERLTATAADHRYEVKIVTPSLCFFVDNYKSSRMTDRDCFPRGVCMLFVKLHTIRNSWLGIAIPGSWPFFSNPEFLDWRRSNPRISGLQKFFEIVFFRVLSDTNNNSSRLDNRNISCALESYFLLCTVIFILTVTAIFYSSDMRFRKSLLHPIDWKFEIKIVKNLISFIKFRIKKLKKHKTDNIFYIVRSKIRSAHCTNRSSTTLRICYFHFVL